MKDIQVDEDGELRCASCGGKHFTEKRTFRAKAGGGAAAVLTFGVAGAAAPLLTKKKLQCKLCGAYNKTGNAKPFDPAQPAPAETKLTAQQEAAQRRMAENRRQRETRGKGAPSTGRPGQRLEMKKPLRPN